MNAELRVLHGTRTDEVALAMAPETSRHYARIETALDYIAAHHEAQPDLVKVARHVGMSEYHFQRVFTRWAGISPKRFLQHLTLEAAKQSLAGSASVLDAAYDAGLSGPSRLHDLFVTYEAVTPGEYKARGAGLTIRYGFHATPFGECVLLLSDRGICGLAFVVDGDRTAALHWAARGWEKAHLIEDAAASAACVPQIFRDDPLGDGAAGLDQPPLKLLLRGTRFQIKVWQALLSVPPGCLTTYQDIARRLGYTAGGQAARAIGQATSSNTIAYLIPCHRVIRKTGAFGGYRWGEGRKLAILGREAAQAEQDAIAVG